jgi:hypothetical protein
VKSKWCLLKEKYFTTLLSIKDERVFFSPIYNVKY